MELLEKTTASIEDADRGTAEKAQARLDSLTKPPGSLGRLEDLAKRVCSIRRTLRPRTANKFIVVMAGDHGVADEGVSAYPREVTAQMVQNFLSGGAAINVLARHAGAEVIVVDIGVASELEPHFGLYIRKIAPGTRNIAAGPAMSRADAVKAIETGIEMANGLVERGADIIATGDMGIANTTPSSAIVAAMTGAPVETVTGRGTGITDDGLARKIRVIEKALAVNRPDRSDPLDVLAKVGGFEMGGIAGIILGAAAARLPVVVDGFISSAGALVAAGLAPRAAQYMISGHASVEKGHRVILEKLGLEPLINLNMRLGEGTGACLALNLVEAAVKIITEMATFAEAGVSEKGK